MSIKTWWKKHNPLTKAEQAEPPVVGATDTNYDYEKRSAAGKKAAKTLMQRNPDYYRMISAAGHAAKAAKKTAMATVKYSKKQTPTSKSMSSKRARA